MNYILEMKAKHAYGIRKKAEEQEKLADMYEEMLEAKMYSKKERIHILTPRAKEKIKETVNNSMTFLYFAVAYGSVNFLEVAYGCFALNAVAKKKYGLSVVYALIGGSTKVMEKVMDGLVLLHEGD